MPITFRVLDKHRILLATFSGVINDEQVIRFWTEFYESDLWKPEYDEISDLREASVEAVTMEGVSKLASIAGQYTANINVVHRTAIIAPEDLTFGLSRFYEAISSQTPEVIMVFRDPASAVEWLGRDETLLTEIG